MTFAAELQDVRKSFDGVAVLDGVDLALEAGRIHGLLGLGGSGKTLVCKLLATLMAPDAGSVRLFGTPVDPSDPAVLRALRARIGMQFQNLALFDFLSVAENVAFPLVQGDVPPPQAEVDARVAAALEAVGLGAAGPLAVTELSGGMQRRIALARAAAGAADLLLLDDPTAGLDPVTSSRIFELIGRIHASRQCTVVVATHDVPRLARIAHAFHVVDAGRVVFSGGLDAARASADERVRTLLDVQEVAWA